VNLALSIIGITFTAFCVWLTVRIINRRERWAKRLAVAVGLAVLIVAGYPASVGLCVGVKSFRSAEMAEDYRLGCRLSRFLQAGLRADERVRQWVADLGLRHVVRDNRPRSWRRAEVIHPINININRALARQPHR
jgi:hypothetical protein